MQNAFSTINWKKCQDYSAKSKASASNATCVNSAGKLCTLEIQVPGVINVDKTAATMKIKFVTYAEVPMHGTCHVISNRSVSKNLIRVYRSDVAQ